MQGSGKWIVGAFVALLGVLGLFVASRAGDAEMHMFGLIFFVASVIFVFWLIRQYAGQRSQPR